MAMVNSSIILISLPDIFKGIGINPLSPGNIGYLLWSLMGYMLVTAVFVVSLGKLGDIRGRVRIYNLGFAIFTAASVILAINPLHDGSGAMWLVGWRLVQGIGGAMLMANSSAIIVDAFPSDQRGMAIGINQVAAIAGSFLGLILGGALVVIDWRLVFWVSVPIGVAGTFWSYHSLHDTGKRVDAKIDWLGNIFFAIGLTSLLTGIVYGIQPYKSSSMAWSSPKVLAFLIVGISFLFAFNIVESKVEHPMFNLHLFKIRAFFTGSVAGLLTATARGGMQFMLIIWLQGIWLPLHGYSFERTPLWAGIYMLPLTLGFLIAGPLSGYFSDKHGARLLSTTGLLIFAGSFVGLLLVPTDFKYWIFALMIFLNGIGGGLFAAPNSTAVMNSVPASARGGAAGIQASFLNTGMVLSMGLFFSLMVVGLSRALPTSLLSGLTAHGVSSAQAHEIAALPPVATLFSSFLGYNPLQMLLGSQAHAGVTAAQWHELTGKSFFPSLLTDPFHHGLFIVFGIAALMAIVAAGFSAARGKRYIHQD